jgi:hypothetical protein
MVRFEEQADVRLRVGADRALLVDLQLQDVRRGDLPHADARERLIDRIQRPDVA